MEKIWLKHYPKNVPAEINTTRYSSLLDLFRQTVKNYNDRPAVTGLGITLTYRQLDEKSDCLATYLQSRGLKKGDRIALMMPNIIQYLISLYAAFKAGLTVVNINPLYTEHELAYQLKDSTPKAIVVLENFAKTVEKALLQQPIEQVIIAKIGDLMPTVKALITDFVLKKVKKVIPIYTLQQAVYFNKALSQGKRLTFIPVELTAQDLAFLQYTGGTTGKAKGGWLVKKVNIKDGKEIDGGIHSTYNTKAEANISKEKLNNITKKLDYAF